MERVGVCSGGFTLFSLLEILKIALNGFLEGVYEPNKDRELGKLWVDLIEVVEKWAF